MEYHRPQLKQSAKAAMAMTRRPKVWFVTVLFLLLCAIVSGLFSVLAPKPFEELEEPLSKALEAASEYAAETGDVERAVERFRRALEGELWDDFMDYVGDVPPGQTYEDAAAGFLVRLLAGSVLAALGASLLSLIANLINVVFDHGYRAYCLGVFRRQGSSVGRLFSAFPRILTVLGAHVMVVLFSLLWSLLGAAVGIVLTFLVNLILDAAAAVVVSTVVCLAVATAVHVVCLQYALIPYIVVEYRDAGIFESIRYSRQLMVGNKLRLLILEVSFLGWFILLAVISTAILTVGGIAAALMIAVLRIVTWGGMLFAASAILAVVVPLPIGLWLTGYRNITYAGFYHIVSFPPEDEAEWEEEPVMADDAAEPTVPLSVPVWLNAPEEEVLPPRPEETPEEAPVEEAPAEEPVAEVPAEEPAEEVPSEEPEAEMTAEEPAEEVPVEEETPAEVELAAEAEEEAPEAESTEEEPKE